MPVKAWSPVLLTKPPLETSAGLPHAGRLQRAEEETPGESLSFMLGERDPHLQVGQSGATHLENSRVIVGTQLPGALTKAWLVPAEWEGGRDVGTVRPSLCPQGHCPSLVLVASTMPQASAISWVPFNSQTRFPKSQL